MNDALIRPVKVTPSMLTFLWDECRCCFWLHARGLHRPQMPFPSVFSRYHDALSRFCLGRCPSELAPSLPTGRFVGGEIWVRSRLLSLPGHEIPLFIRGRLDHLARFDDGSWGIVDFKTMRPRAETMSKYARQLHAYAWALERSAPDALHRTPITRMGLYCLDPVAVSHLTDGGPVHATLSAHWIAVERDDAAFERFLAEVLGVLTQPAPPPASQSCSCCRYWNRRQTLAREFATYA